MSFLVIDVGNTRLKWALYEHATFGARQIAYGAIVHEEIDDLAQETWSQFVHAGNRPTGMLGCIVAGEAVKRRVEEQLIEAWQLPANWMLPVAQECGLTNGYDSPSRLGADRWAAMIGARQHYTNLPIVLAIVGTAVTVEAITPYGKFMGGMILPGFGLMLEALENGTAGLRVYPGDVLDFPKNTSDALMTGGADAIAGAVERMYMRLAKHCGAAPVLVITGGAAPKLIPSLQIANTLQEQLIFEGLLTIAANSSAAQ